MSTREDRLLNLVERCLEAGLCDKETIEHLVCLENPDLAEELRHHLAFVRRLDLAAGRGPAVNGTNPVPTTFQDRVQHVIPPSISAASRTVSLCAESKQDCGPTPLPGQTAATTLFRSTCPPGYEILEVLGRGGMGIVYKARHISLNRLVALKMILGSDHAGQEEQIRFLVEAKAVATIDHPGIVRIHEYGTQNGMPYFAMDFCKGGSLATHLAESPVPGQEAARLVEQIARAMQAAHDAGIVHRDLKPANILLENGSPRVSDFGLAKRLDADTGLTATGALLGTPSYMAPEQASGHSRQVGPAADIWAMGAILFECLTGRPPFRAATVADTLLQVLGEEPPSPRKLNRDVPPDLETICLKCLHKKSAQRYSSARALADDLHRWQTGEPILARPASRVELVVKWVKRRPTQTALIATICIALLASVLGLTFYVLNAAHLARVDRQRDHARVLWLHGEQCHQAGQLALARSALEQSFAMLRWLPDDESSDLRETIASRLEQVRREVDHQARILHEQHDQAQKRHQFLAAVTQADRAHDELLFLALSFQGGDPLALRDSIRGLASLALQPYGLAGPRAQEPMQPLGRLPDQGLSKEQILQATGRCIEVLVIWAEAEACPIPGEESSEYQSRLRQALHLLDQGEALTLLTKHPTPRVLVARRAQHLAEVGESVRAAIERQKASTGPGSTALDCFLLALDQFRKGNPAKAAVACEQALRLQPDYFWAQYLRGVCSLSAAEWAKADAWLTASMSRRPRCFWPLLMRALARGEAGDAGSAAHDLASACQLASDGLQRYQYHMIAGRLAGLGGNWERARAEFRLAVASQPAGSHTAHVNLSHAYRKLKQHQEALTELTRAIEKQPTSGHLYYARAQVYLDIRQIAQARDDFAKAVALGKDQKQPWLAGALVEGGYLMHQAGQFQDALAAFDAALVVLPSYPQALRQRAETLLRLERHAEAEVALDAYLKVARADASIWQTRGMLYALREDYTRAIEAYSHALTLRSDAEILAQRGWLYLKAESVPLALVDFEQALKLSPEHAVARCGRARVRIRRGQMEEALKDAACAVRARNLTAPLLHQLACVHALAARQGSPGSAIARQHERRAVDFLVQAVNAVPAPRRPAFWRGRVESDTELRDLLSHPTLVKLARSSREQP